MIETTLMELTGEDIDNAIKNAEAGAYDPDFLTAREWGKVWGVDPSLAGWRLKKGLSLGIVDKRRVHRIYETGSIICAGYRVNKKIPITKKYYNKGINWDKQPLGQVKDTELARRLGVAHSCVRIERYARGIPSNPEYIKYAHKNIDWDSKPLGEFPDIILAKILNVHNSLVARQRKKRGIPSYRSQNAK